MVAVHANFTGHFTVHSRLHGFVSRSLQPAGVHSWATAGHAVITSNRLGTGFRLQFDLPAMLDRCRASQHQTKSNENKIREQNQKNQQQALNMLPFQVQFFHLLPSYLHLSNALLTVTYGIFARFLSLFSLFSASPLPVLFLLERSPFFIIIGIHVLFSHLKRFSNQIFQFKKAFHQMPELRFRECWERERGNF